MSGKNIFWTIFFVVLVGLAITACVLISINFDKIKAGTKGQQLYTIDEINKARDEGYKNGSTASAEKDKTIDSYKSILSSCQEDIKNLNKIKLVLDEEKNTLNSRLVDLNLQIDALTKNVTDLTAIKTTNEETNKSNVNIINSLNLQIVNLNNTISSMNISFIQNTNLINELNIKINELQTSISYYEKLLAAYQNENKAVVKFMFNEAVYNVQVVDKNTIVNVANPVDTEYVKFLGWTVNGTDIIDLTTYNVADGLILIAKIEKFYLVSFNVDNSSLSTQKVLANGTCTTVTAPTKNGYVFKGWSINGTDLLDISTYNITKTTTFIAVYQINTYTVVYKDYDNSILSTQTINHGSSSVVPISPVREYYTFTGWDTTPSVITSDTIFVAKYIAQISVTYEDPCPYSCESVSMRFDYGSKILIPYTPEPFYYVGDVKKIFQFWSVDNINQLDLSTFELTEDITIYAVYR